MMHLSRIFFVFVLCCVHRGPWTCGLLSVINSGRLATIITAGIVPSLLPPLLPSESLITCIGDCLMLPYMGLGPLFFFFFWKVIPFYIFLSLLQFG